MYDQLAEHGAGIDASILGGGGVKVPPPPKDPRLMRQVEMVNALRIPAGLMDSEASIGARIWKLLSPGGWRLRALVPNLVIDAS